MPCGNNYKYSNVCADLEKRIQQCNFRIKQTEENESKLKKLRENIEAYTKIISNQESSLAKLKPLLEDIQRYTTDRRKQSLNSIQQVLMSAGNIVPASNSKITFKMENGEAWFETEDGLSLDRTEGSGYRATLSLFMRNVFLRSNPQYLQTLVLDELFAKLSPERSAILSTYLSVLGQHTQIISIEQKPEVFADAECTSYFFFLDEGKTIVRKE